MWHRPTRAMDLEKAKAITDKYDGPSVAELIPAALAGIGIVIVLFAVQAGWINLP